MRKQSQGSAVTYVAPMRAALAPSNTWHMLVWDYIRHVRISEDSVLGRGAHAAACPDACGFVCITLACAPDMLFQQFVLQDAILYNHAQT